jgi:hypothetical protein
MIVSPSELGNYKIVDNPDSLVFLWLVGTVHAGEPDAAWRANWMRMS